MKHNTSFSLHQALQTSWNITKKHWFFMALAFLTSLILSYCIDQFSSFFGTLLGIIFAVLLSLGWTHVALRYVHNKKVRARTFFEKTDLFWKFLGASLLYGCIVVLGLIFFIIPGVYFALRYTLYTYFIVDKNTTIRQAFTYSAQATKGSIMKLLLFTFVSLLIVLIGIIFFGIGILIAGPFVMVANAYIYTVLSSRITTSTQETALPKETSQKEE